MRLLLMVWVETSRISYRHDIYYNIVVIIYYTWCKKKIRILFLVMNIVFYLIFSWCRYFSYIDIYVDSRYVYFPYSMNIFQKNKNKIELQNGKSVTININHEKMFNLSDSFHMRHGMEINLMFIENIEFDFIMNIDFTLNACSF